MIFFYKSYENCLLATIMSLFSYFCYMGGIMCIGMAISSGEDIAIGVVCLVVLIAIGYGLGKLAENIAIKKNKKLAAKRAAKANANVNNAETTVNTLETSRTIAQVTQTSSSQISNVKVEEQKEKISNSKSFEEKNKTDWTCTKCGNINSGNFCKECGTKKPVYCTNCGKKLISGQNFCSECGTKVIE